MQNGIVLSEVLGMSRGRGHFPLSLRRPGHRRACKLKHVAGRRVCPVNDDGATKVSIRVT
jgi:hypothetical protein